MQSDLISRKDVITALIDADWIKTTAQQAVIAEILNKIPSVKPESKLIANISVNKEELQQLVADAAKDIIKDSGWIPVSERLPENAGVYIVSRWFSDGCESMILTDACYFDGTSTWHNDNRINHSREYVDKKIVAWMPLPEPYTEEGNE